MPLPHCDTLFTTYLEPWYSASDLARKEFKTTRPDMLTTDRYIGAVHAELSVIEEKGECEAMARIERMLGACRSDWPKYLKIFGDIDDHWIEAFDDYWGRERVASVIKRSEPTDFSNDYLILVCEFGAALGHVLCGKEPHLAWVYDCPYWESSLVDTRSGSVIPPFHWSIKKFSEYGLEDGFAAKVEACVNLLNDRASNR